MSAITPYDWAIIAFVIGVTFLCVFMLTVPLLLGGKSWGRAKQEQFESGVVSAGGARIRLSAFNSIEELVTEPTGQIPAQSSGRVKSKTTPALSSEKE